MALTPEDVRNKQFTTVRLREGYDEDEVDAFLDEVEGELTRLLRENEDLRAKLAAATRAAAQAQNQRKELPAPQDGPPQRPGAPVPAAISGPPVPQQGMPQQGMPQGMPQQGMPPQGMPPHMQQQMGGHPGQPALPGPGGPQLQPAPQMGGPMGGHTMGGLAPMQQPQQMMPQQQNNDSAARVLALAQQTADQAIAEARSEANKIVGEARSRAEGLERDARSKADALERDAQEKHRVAMGSLESARATLERKVEDLRAFEREYRTRLKSYLETQLRQLESQADDSLAPPRTPATASLPPAAPLPQPAMSPVGASPMSAGGPSFGGNQTFGGQQSFGGGQNGPSFGGNAFQPAGGQPQPPAAMTQPMAAVRPQPPLQQAPQPMRGFLIDQDDEN